MSKFAVYPALTAATVDAADLLLLKDTSATATVKFPISDLILGALTQSTGAAIVVSSVLSVGANLATNPAFQVNYSAGSVATGLKVTGAASGSGIALAALSSGGNENLTIDAKGSGTITFNATGTGNVVSSRSLVSSLASTTALVAGANGTTNPVLQVDTNTASVATGLKVTGAAAASGLALAVISSGTNENLTVNAKGSGTITFGSVSTGAVTITPALNVSAATTITSTSASALTVGANGATNPVLQVNANTASVATGLAITGAAATAGADVTVVSSGTNENLTINAKGSGTISLNPTATGNVITTRPVVITSASANAFAVGRLGATTPGFVVDASTSTNTTGLKITPAATGAGLALATVSGGTNENVTFDAKGSGTVSLNATATGNVITPRPIVITSASATAFAVGLAGTTNPALNVDASTATSATGLNVKSAAAAAGLAVSVVSSGTNENLTIDAKGSGTIDLNATGTGNILTPRAVLSRGATAGIGYATGAGGTVTQATDKTTGVTLNKVSGQITTAASALAAGAEATFTLTNSAIAAPDVVVACVGSGGTSGAYAVDIAAIGTGSCAFVVSNLTAGSLSEAPVINYVVIKGASA